VRAIRRSLAGFSVVVCLGITGADVAWADGASLPGPHVEYVEDPYAPHVTRGQTVRIGTMVGQLHEAIDVTAVGLTAAAGYRSGRLAIESEYTYLAFQESGPSSLSLGDGHRLGLVARFDVLRIGSRWVGANSMLAVYVEGGVGVAWNRWSMPASDEPGRIVPADTERIEGQAGLGIQIDHRLQEPIGFPKRIGWFLGWRVALSPADPEPAVLCRGVSCRPLPAMPEQRYVDRSLLFQSSLAVTW
jgi:hypothetical protein